MLSEVGSADCVLVSFNASVLEANVAEHLIFANSLSRLVESVSEILPDKALSFSIILEFDVQVGQPAKIILTGYLWITVRRIYA